RARMAAASKSRHVPLHPRVDPELSGGCGGRAVDGGPGFHPCAALPRAWRADGDSPRIQMKIDTSKWSGEGAFTQVLIDRLQHIEEVDLFRVEDAPASRS